MVKSLASSWTSSILLLQSLLVNRSPSILSMCPAPFNQFLCETFFYTNFLPQLLHSLLVYSVLTVVLQYNVQIAAI